ncbi:MAG: hypothetical protein SGBAC_000616 [Bacillariaceae sp.]
MAGESTTNTDNAENPDAFDDRASSQTSGTKRSTPDSGTSEEGSAERLDDVELDPARRREARKMRRVMANRRSARESRERRKKLLVDLQESVEGLTTENSLLSKENLTLRQELASLVEQAGGATALSMIPNIQSLLQSTQELAGLSVQSPSVASSGATGSTGATGVVSASGATSESTPSALGVAGLPPNMSGGNGDASSANT